MGILLNSFVMSNVTTNVSDQLLWYGVWKKKKKKNDVISNVVFSYLEMVVVEYLSLPSLLVGHNGPDIVSVDLKSQGVGDFYIFRLIRKNY